MKIIKNKKFVTIGLISLILVGALCSIFVYFKLFSYQGNKKDVTTNQVQVLTKYINIRSKASIDGEILGKVSKGEYYNIIDTIENDKYTWYKIKTSRGIVGYIANPKEEKYLIVNIINDEASTSSIVEEIENTEISSSNIIEENKDVQSSSRQQTKPNDGPSSSRQQTKPNDNTSSSSQPATTNDMPSSSNQPATTNDMPSSSNQPAVPSNNNTTTKVVITIENGVQKTVTTKIERNGNTITKTVTTSFDATKEYFCESGFKININKCTKTLLAVKSYYCERETDRFGDYGCYYDMVYREIPTLFPDTEEKRDNYCNQLWAQELYSNTKIYSYKRVNKTCIFYLTVGPVVINYSCDDNFILSGTNCIQTKDANFNYKCPSGYNVIDKKCIYEIITVETEY